MRTPPIAEVNVTKMVSTAAPHALWRPLSRAGARGRRARRGRARAARRRSAPCAAIARNGGRRRAVSAARRHAARALGCACACGRACGGRAAAAAGEAVGCGERLAEPARRRRRARARQEAPVGADDAAGGVAPYGRERLCDGVNAPAHGRPRRTRLSPGAAARQGPIPEDFSAEALPSRSSSRPARSRRHSGRSEIMPSSLEISQTRYAAPGLS